MTIKTRNIIWLAGLLEGEGCFSLSRGKYPIINLVMTDEDIVVRVAALTKTRVYHRKNYWRIEVNGPYAIMWMMTLYTLLGKRRRSAIADVIKVWREHSTNLPIGLHPACHPDRKLHALELCSPCYMRQWKRKRLLEVI